MGIEVGVVVIGSGGGDGVVQMPVPGNAPFFERTTMPCWREM